MSRYPPTYVLTLNKAGTGKGEVTSNLKGISCGDNCSSDTGTYNANTQVTLTATAASGSTFAGWNGACNGTGSCLVTMDSAKTVAATFNTETQDLNAEAGSASKTGTVGTSVPLDGSASTGATTYNWALTKPTGSNATISGVTRAKASFRPDIVGQYVATLTVGDGTKMDQDTLTINVSSAAPAAPVADAGDDRTTTVNVPTPNPLDGTDSKNAASFKWDVTNKEPNSTPVLASPEASTTTFTADVAGTYTVTLTVLDSEGKQPSRSTVKVKVNPASP